MLNRGMPGTRQYRKQQLDDFKDMRPEADGVRYEPTRRKFKTNVRVHA